MPQVCKSEEQLLLEERITKTSAVLRTMKLQLQAIRRRNKAARERSRRASRTQALKEKQSRAFEELYEQAIKLEAANEDFLDDEEEEPMFKRRKCEKPLRISATSNAKMTEEPKVQVGGSSSSKDKIQMWKAVRKDEADGERWTGILFRLIFRCVEIIDSNYNL